jgi:hypothetical protein
LLPLYLSCHAFFVSILYIYEKKIKNTKCSPRPKIEGKTSEEFMEKNEVTSIQKTEEKKSNKSHGNPTGKKKCLTKTIEDEQNSDKNNVESK